MCVSVKEIEISWDDVYNMIADLTIVNLHFFIVIIVEISTDTPTINSIGVMCSNETFIIDYASLIPPNASKTTTIIDELKKSSSAVSIFMPESVS